MGRMARLGRDRRLGRQAEGSRAEGSRAEGSRAEGSRAEGSRAAPSDLPETPSAEVDYLWRFKEGDSDAFDLLVTQFQRRLVKFFYRLCWDMDRSEDFTQNLFLKLVRTADRYQPQGKLSTFIFRIATNLWIDHYRAQRPRQRLYSLDQAMLSGHEPRSAVCDLTPAQIVEADEERRRMREALEQLTEPHRIVFELAVYQQLPYAEISDVLEIPVGTVKSRMHNSVRALKAQLAETDDGAATGHEEGAQGVGRFQPGAAGRSAFGGRRAAGGSA